jgi:hypothetical protein
MHEIFQGVLTQEKGKTYLLGTGGRRLLASERIWSGYVRHWIGRKVFARPLPQRDYERGAPIIIMWPRTQETEIPFVELYFNERLPKYRASFFGHIAANVDGEIFNFSHLMNENEVMTREDYFFRPALGEFAPDPETGRFNTGNRDRPYYDKFGRLFMRTVHVLRIEGLKTGRLSEIYHNRLKAIHATPPDPKKPEKYKDFNMFTRNCATLIRDGLRKYGFSQIRGILPRELFVSAAYHFRKLEEEGVLKTELIKMKQLKVPEAPYSAGVPILNPINRGRIQKQLA